MTPGPLIAASPAMREIESFLPRVAAAMAPVVIEGETGTGKGRIAEALHQLSPRRLGPFEVLSCGAITESLAESEFFGHGRGAFTHAFEAQSGRLERANGGTLVLDHVEDLSSTIQAKLLRAIEEGRIQRLGESVERTVDVRYVATSRGPLKDAIANGTFRDDLYHRLSVITIPVPPLRERVEDILPLAAAFLSLERNRGKTLAKGFSEAAEQILRAYSWPGNVRELHSTIERATLRHDGSGDLDASTLPKNLLSPDTVVRSFRGAAPTLKEVERAYILWVLENSTGTKAEAARILGISRKSLWEKCKRFGIV
ncbi:MAG: sigma-54-dependent Fis family transcriptional regulator [Vicinamibacteria bacterium]|nr:sigma-54-dependent Fis family transcriptional regulator [Vicinamibacteria bacterium]MBP9945120.1 sigma-54-dependent Fis family transcriptional regulator [Vicinamibacteria bacterium]